jgi:hypothetical protein
MTQIIYPITETFNGETYNLQAVENDPAQPIEHISLGLSRVIKQYQNSPNFLAALTALLAQNDTCEALLQSMYELPSIAVMQGVNLDVIGRIVGITRDIPNGIQFVFFGFDGESDQTVFGELGQDGIGSRFYDLGEPITETDVLGDIEYRLLLQAKILKNASKATGEDILNALALLFSVNVVNVDDYGGMEMGVAIGRQLTQIEQAILQNIDILPRPACVLLDSVVNYDAGNCFGFSDLNDYNMASIASIAANGDGTVTLVLVSSLFGFSDLSWIVQGVEFDVAGTGVADGGPFLAASVTSEIVEPGSRIIISVIFYDPSASGSATGVGTISEVSLGNFQTFGELSNPSIGGPFAEMFVPFNPS